MAQLRKLKKRVIHGATINKVDFAWVGKIISFNNAFSPSANGWPRPHIPTTFGPLRR